MNSQWTNFLQQQNLTMNSDAECALSDLSQYGLIKVSGEDAVDFLQGQLTNDIKMVDSETAQISTYCSPKGRMLAQFLIFEHQNELYLQLPAERLDAVLKRLSMFVMRSKVVLKNSCETLITIGLSGSCVEALLPQAPAQAMSVKQTDNITQIRISGETPRVMLVGSFDEISAFWKNASEQAAATDENYWALQNIRAGVPDIFDATAEAFVPQTLNLQLLNGISFTKGCYTGQEVVARMKYLGKLKRRMYLASFTTEQTPKIGDSLYSASSQSPQGAGKIVDVRPSPNGGYEALVMAQISSVEADDLQLGDMNGAHLEITEPPYGFGEE